MNSLQLINFSSITECEPLTDGYTAKGGRFYKAIIISSTMNVALKACEKEGSQLAMFHRPEDKSIIKEIIEESELR